MTAARRIYSVQWEAGLRCLSLDPSPPSCPRPCAQHRHDPGPPGGLRHATGFVAWAPALALALSPCATSAGAGDSRDELSLSQESGPSPHCSLTQFPPLKVTVALPAWARVMLGPCLPAMPCLQWVFPSLPGENTCREQPCWQRAWQL